MIKPKGPREKDWFYQQNGQQIGCRTTLHSNSWRRVDGSNRTSSYGLRASQLGFPPSQVPELGFLQRKPRGSPHSAVVTSWASSRKLSIPHPRVSFFRATRNGVVRTTGGRSGERNVLRLAREKTEKERFEAELAERQALREAIESQNARIKQIAKSESSSTSQSLKYPVGTRGKQSWFLFRRVSGLAG